MSDEPLRIRIELESGGDASAALKKAATELKILETQARQGSVSFDVLEKNSRNLELQLQKLHATGKITDQQFAAMGRTFQLTSERASQQFVGMATALNSNALPAVNEFTRIISDAPYGLRGMANNIQQLATLFSSLAVQSGGAGNAIKSMMSMMLGPAGIVLAVNAIVSLAVAFGDKLFPSVDKTRDAADKLNAILLKLGERTAEDDIGRLAVRMNELRKAADDAASSPGFLALLAGAMPGAGLLGFTLSGAGPAGLAAKQGELDFKEASKKRENEIRDLQLKRIDDTYAREKASLAAHYIERMRAAKNDEALRRELELTYYAEVRRLDEKEADRKRKEREAKSEQRRGDTEDYWKWLEDMREAGYASGSVRERGQALARKNRGIDWKKKALAEQFGEADAGTDDFTRAFVSNINVMARSVDVIGESFANMFGGAKTLLGSFAKAFADTMTQLAVKYAIAGLFNFLLPGSGIAASLLPSVFGGSASPSSVSGGLTQSRAYSQTAAGRAMGKLQLRTEISGKNLAIIVEAGNRTLATQTL